MSDEYDYEVAEVVRVVDGDTLDVRLERAFEIDIGFRITQQLVMATVQRVRLIAVDTPERNQAGFVEATAYVRGWAARKTGAGVLRARTYKTDSFGRWLADLYDCETGASLSECLLRDGLAQPYPARQR